MTPLILPLGDRGLLVRFGNDLTDSANASAISLAAKAEAARIPGVLEVVPNLVSVLLRYAPQAITFDRLAGEVRLLASVDEAPAARGRLRRVAVRFDGEDLAEVAAALGLSTDRLVALHNDRPLRVLATGFAPGFVYCGLHPTELTLPRRTEVRRRVPPGTVLFAAGQTAITSTPIPSGWHVIGHTSFRNFDPAAEPPANIVAGDLMQFEVAS